jgi:aspartate/methionine/tyrosine aminotransferase
VLTRHIAITTAAFSIDSSEAPAVNRSLLSTKFLIRSRIARLLPSIKCMTDGGASFLHYYSDRVLLSPHAELRYAANLLENRGPEVMDLGSGAPDFDLVPSGSSKLPADRRGWPTAWGLAELRSAVAQRLASDQGLTVNPEDEVLITHGASGAFGVALDAFMNAGDRVVVFEPTSPLFSLFLQYRKARICWVPTSMDNGQTQFSKEALVKALRRARIIVLALPNNPTGGILSAENLDLIAWWAQKRDLLIVNDVVFDRYVYDGRPPSIASLPAARRRTITIGSVSKGYALASARIGWLTGHRHLVRPCAVACSLRTPFVPTLCQQIALTALREPPESFQSIHKGFDSRRHYAFERLQAMGLKPQWPSGGFFFWIPVTEFGISGREFVERLLLLRKVLVWPGDLFGPSAGTHVRLSYAAEDGRLREGLGRMAEFVKQLRGERTTPVKYAA